jgi:hypothetical protein
MTATRCRELGDADRPTVSPPREHVDRVHESVELADS